jgi:hypothetical protein
MIRLARWQAILFVLSTYLAIFPVSSSAELVGITKEGLVIRIDETTGTGELIGPSGLPALGSLAQGSSGTLFSATIAAPCFTSGRSSQLITIDRNTGVGTVIVTLKFSDAPEVDGDVNGLAYSPVLTR